MIGHKQRREALFVLFRVMRKYGDKTCPVDIAGPNYRPLRDAETLGWVEFIGHRCKLTDEGVRQADQYDRGRLDIPA